jgi:intracellular sulfur oxidation DsrE/DsrF family protein
MGIRLLLVLAGLACSTLSLADEPSFGPIIEGYGPTYPISDRDVALPVDFTYKAVFDLARYPGETSGLNPYLVSAARFLNMHARNGVPAENMDLAIVVHGAAVKNLLNDEAYEARYNVANPNLELLTKLHAAGVRIFVCGQSMTFGDVNKSELAAPAQVALSAMTMLTVLQSDGYALLP